jgi:integrase
MHDSKGHPLSLAEARRVARQLSSQYLELQTLGKDLAEVLESERREAARHDTPESDEGRPATTFGALMETYLKDLESAGKASAGDVANTVENHITPHVEIWRKSAADVSLDDCLEILEPLTTTGKLTTARKVRAYIRRAYALALRSRTSAQASAYRQFGIVHNPAADVATIEGASKPRERNLSLLELRALWKRINLPDEPIGPLLRAYLLLGGQRLAQLRRATIKDIADQQLTLWDSKGKRTHPRRHVVPILPEAQEAIDEMRGAQLGPYLFTFTHGESPADTTRAGKLIKRLSADMLSIGELTAPFSLGDLRRTVETRLAAAGLHSDTLAQLQSHGLSGVQWRHYNRHDYHEEKLSALKILRDLINGKNE